MRVRLTPKGRELRQVLSDLFARHVEALQRPERFGAQRMDDMNQALGRIERFWTDQIRYIY